MPKNHNLLEDQQNNLVFEFPQYFMELSIYKRERASLEDTKDSKINLLLDKFINVVWEKLFDEAFLFYTKKK